LDICNFSLDVIGDHSYYDETQSVRLDLSTNERTISTPDAPLATGPAHAPDAQYLALVRKEGYTGPIKRMVAGQPCDEWRSPWGATTCIWSGGTQWGFTTQPDDQFMEMEGVDLHRIVLQAEPAAASIGDRLSTEKFSLNAPLDLDRMLPTLATKGGQ